MSVSLGGEKLRNGKSSEMENLLPEGWKRKTDPSSGKFYYVNRKLRRTTWTKPEGEKTEVLRGKVSSDVKTLIALRRRGFDWIPGEDNIRPTPETREKKVKWLESVMSKYVGRRDFVLHDLFRCETRRNEKGLMLVDEASLKRVGKKKKLYPNMFPYDLPSGTIHYVMWYTWTRPEDSEITSDIANALGKDADFVWYENPKMSIPEIFHVQVFAKRSGF